jgi:hypothetical protein
MKFSRFWILLLIAISANGCVLFHHRQKPAVPTPAPASAKAAPGAKLHPIITPDNSLTAKVASYNSIGRFVVLTFPVGPMPVMDQTLFLYHNGLKVGEVKITGPRRDNDIVADLVTGTAQDGDEVRDQ